MATDPKKEPANPPPSVDPEALIEHILGGGIRGEVAGCPTGLFVPGRAARKKADDSTGADVPRHPDVPPGKESTS